MLEEYVDAVHLLISIAHDFGYESHKYEDVGYYDLNELVLGITNLASITPTWRSVDHVRTLFNLMIQLGYQLGFNEDMVIEAYFAKNKVNRERQESGY